MVEVEIRPPQKKSISYITVVPEKKKQKKETIFKTIVQEKFKNKWPEYEGPTEYQEIYSQPPSSRYLLEKLSDL